MGLSMLKVRTAIVRQMPDGMVGDAFCDIRMSVIVEDERRAPFRRVCTSSWKGRRQTKLPGTGAESIDSSRLHLLGFPAVMPDT